MSYTPAKVIETTTVVTTTTTTAPATVSKPHHEKEAAAAAPSASSSKPASTPVTHIYGKEELRAMQTSTDPKDPVPIALPPGPAVFDEHANRMRSLDADMQAVLTEFALLEPKPITSLTPAEARKQPTLADAVAKLMKKAKIDYKPHRGLSVSNKSHDNFKMRIYTPDKTSKDSHLPIVIYFRGGGFVIADLDVYDHAPASLARQLGAIVISVDYPMAPEHKFPAAHEAAFNAYRYIIEQAPSWGYDSNHIALVGESAGGNLALATAIAVRDSTVVPKPCAVIAVYPIAATMEPNKPSMVEDAHAKPLCAPMMTWFFNTTLPNEAARADPRLNLVAASLAGLPPVTLISADVDPLRSDADLLEKKLRHAGVDVVHETFKGVVHEFFGMPRRVVTKAGMARDLAVQRILAAWTRTGGTFVVAAKPMQDSTTIKDTRDRNNQTTTHVM